MAVRLQERDERILRHLARYRLSTPEIIFNLYFKPEGHKSTEGMKSTLRRLWKDPESAFLDSKKLYGSGRDVYYHLTPQGASYLGFANATDIGHGFDKMDVRARHLGCLLFACGGETPRPKFTVEEFQTCFPGTLERGTDFYARFFSDAYFLDDRDGVRRLGRLLVDTGGDTTKVLQRAAETAVATLPRFVAAGRFSLALVLPTAEKLRRVRQHMRQAPLDPPIPFLLDEQPGILPLLATAL